MKTSRASRQRLPLTCPAVLLLTLAGACSDDDQTGMCLGPGCASYQGSAGRNTLSSGLAGASAAGDAGPSDAGAAGGAGGASGAGAGGTAGSDGGAPPLEPCEVAFVLPFAPDGGAVTLAGRDDVDGEACGPSFSARVVLQSTASTVTLFVNDNPVGAAAVAGGIARFEAALGNRGELGNALRA